MAKDNRKELNINEKIGENLRLLRQVVGLSQRDLADILGVSYQQVQKYEAGSDRVPVEGFVRLRTTLGISMDSLIADEPDWVPVSNDLVVDDDARGPTGMPESYDPFVLGQYLQKRVRGVKPPAEGYKIARVVDVLCAV
ncbi:helix-turn-helix domain-containing protein [Micavibrio aeruginosavorus]|uniref:Helix-turn-helix family protein n=1 Tax=Micavibrio aeruginosavorus (strain ARL-13) TaxID=856793 RepID=G2KPZ1_MICAA|nr:helix-turn-helix transcriptional regulator [Micavibrio aeruginosavorus]AEP10359.1 helix-turn-helix family protein [Micavibrio aeruginosavorus ARL-13]